MWRKWGRRVEEEEVEEVEEEEVDKKKKKSSKCIASTLNVAACRFLRTVSMYVILLTLYFVPY
jgi:hypothetical protein